MKLLAGIAFLGLAASVSAVRATPFDFTYSGGLVTFTVPTTDTYQILAYGAQGGNLGSGNIFGPGGRGAEIGGAFSLTVGEILQIAVGGAGSVLGGGGGSFVVGPGNTPLVIAGGGGGGGEVGGIGVSGGGGLTDPNGNGNGGPAGVGSDPGGGGGGFFSAGGNRIAIFGGDGGGGAFPELTGGSLGGGFGGGGGAGVGPGGGGGYSGGEGGTVSAGGLGPGGGGGSFDAGIDQILLADFRTGNGEVVITELAAAVPEPASIALLAVGLAGLMAVWRRNGKPLSRDGYDGQTWAGGERCARGIGRRVLTK